MNNIKQYLVLKDLTMPSSNGKIRTLKSGSIVEGMKSSCHLGFDGYKAVCEDLTTVLSWKIVTMNPEYFEPIAELPPQIGDTWINHMGYRIKILDVGIQYVWCEWENGNKDAWNIKDFTEKYFLHKRKGLVC